MRSRPPIWIIDKDNKVAEVTFVAHTILGVHFVRVDNGFSVTLDEDDLVYRKPELAHFELARRYSELSRQYAEDSLREMELAKRCYLT